MKKFMLLAALLAGGVPSLLADRSREAVLRCVENLTEVEFTYYAPDGSPHVLGPNTRTILNVALHDSMRSEAKSKSHFVSRGGMVKLCLDYKKSVFLAHRPELTRLKDAELQQRLWLSLSCVVPDTNGGPSRFWPIYEHDSGLHPRPVVAPSSRYDISLTLAGNTLENSFLDVVETNPLTSSVPVLNFRCSPLSTPEASPRSPRPEGPRLVESPR